MSSSSGVRPTIPPATALLLPAATALICLLLFASCRTGKTLQAADDRPNVVVILMDDLGYGDLECYGGFPYHTPHLNKMAVEGMRFTHFYAAQAVCSASRAALLTGCYPNRVGISGALDPYSKTALHPAEETIAELLKKAGYRTGMVGKWHLGCKEPYLPLQHGFDEYLGLPYSNDMWKVNYDGTPFTDTTKYKFRYPPLPLIDGNKTVRVISNLEDQGMLTSWYTERAVQFIRNNQSRPFFLYVAHNMPHVPIAVSEHYRGITGQGLFADLMTEIDASIGTILKALDNARVGRNTLVIFTSDNGPWLTFGNHAGNTGGLREGKGTAWEGGVRVPCLMRWPARIPAGSICNNMVAMMDLLPTICRVCKAGSPEKTIDGVDILPLLTGDNRSAQSPRDEFVYYYDRNSLKAIRKGTWKLVFPCISQTYLKTEPGRDGWPGKYATDTVGLALYDLWTDPGESRDVKSQHPEVVRQLNERAAYYRKELGDDLTRQQGSGVRPAARLGQQ